MSEEVTFEREKKRTHVGAQRVKVTLRRRKGEGKGRAGERTAEGAASGRAVACLPA